MARPAGQARAGRQAIPRPARRQPSVQVEKAKPEELTRPATGEKGRARGLSDGASISGSGSLPPSPAASPLLLSMKARRVLFSPWPTGSSPLHARHGRELLCLAASMSNSTSGRRLLDARHGGPVRPLPPRRGEAGARPRGTSQRRRRGGGRLGRRAAEAPTGKIQQQQRSERRLARRGAVVHGPLLRRGTTVGTRSALSSVVQPHLLLSDAPVFCSPFPFSGATEGVVGAMRQRGGVAGSTSHATCGGHRSVRLRRAQDPGCHCSSFYCIGAR
ncbi:unnamed protein product [Urochloa humidicola]